jgi:hypothetical protein
LRICDTDGGAVDKAGDDDWVEYARSLREGAQGHRAESGGPEHTKPGFAVEAEPASDETLEASDEKEESVAILAQVSAAS